MLNIEDILNVKFMPGSMFKPGYHAEEVDEYLDEVVQVMVHAQSTADFEPLANPKFTVLRSSTHSYKQEDVDAFLVAIVDTFQSRAKNLEATEPYLEEKRQEKKALRRSQTEPVAIQQSTAIITFDETQLDAKAKEIAEMLSANMFDSAEVLTVKVKDILKN